MFFLCDFRSGSLESDGSRKNKKWNSSKVSETSKCAISVQFPKSKWDSEDEESAEVTLKTPIDDEKEEGEIETEVEDKIDTPERPTRVADPQICKQFIHMLKRIQIKFNLFFTQTKN